MGDDLVSRDSFPKEFLKLLDSVTNKRARVVIDTILEKGFITTEEITNRGYGHAPRAARDVRELGIPLETFNVIDSNGKRIGAYKFGDLSKVRNNILQGRKVFSKRFKENLASENGCQCEVDQTPYELRYLQVDHRVPYEVSGDTGDVEPQNFMLICTSCNRAKSWSCEHCENWLEHKDPAICKSCYWASPSNYSHIAMREVRRVDLLFENQDVETHDYLKELAEKQGKSVQQYILEILERNK